MGWNASGEDIVSRDRDGLQTSLLKAISDASNMKCLKTTKEELNPILPKVLQKDLAVSMQSLLQDATNDNVVPMTMSVPQEESQHHLIKRRLRIIKSLRVPTAIGGKRDICCIYCIKSSGRPEVRPNRSKNQIPPRRYSAINLLRDVIRFKKRAHTKTPRRNFTWNLTSFRLSECVPSPSACISCSLPSEGQRSPRCASASGWYLPSRAASSNNLCNSTAGKACRTGRLRNPCTRHSRRLPLYTAWFPHSEKFMTLVDVLGG